MLGNILPPTPAICCALVPFILIKSVPPDGVPDVAIRSPVTLIYDELLVFDVDVAMLKKSPVVNEFVKSTVEVPPTANVENVVAASLIFAVMGAVLSRRILPVELRLP